MASLSLRFLLCSVLLCLLSARLVCGGMDLTKYKLTWDQDFTVLSSLSVSAWGPAGPGGSDWIAHTPYRGDWCNFQDPAGEYSPFHLIPGGPLVIRAQRVGDGLGGGLLSSVDTEGRGFSQVYGYFEMKARLPSGSGSWPAFWFNDVTRVTNGTIGAMELDILELFGDAIGTLRSGVAWWDHDSSRNWGLGFPSPRCSMTTGYHTYGMDLQPDNITFYYDRSMLWQIVNNIPGGHSSTRFDRPIYLMVDMAYGGGTSKNNVSYILEHPQDMLVEYVRVWQGRHGSDHARDTRNAQELSWWAGELNLFINDSISISGLSLTFTPDGRLTIMSTNNVLLYQTDIAAQQCDSSCKAAFQGDGNLVFSSAKGVYWGANTWGNNLGMMSLTSEWPYLEIFGENCVSLWTINNKSHGWLPKKSWEKTVIQTSQKY